MATKIVTKNSSTAGAAPTATDLVQGELAVNVADKRLFTEDNGGSIVELGTNPYNFTANHNGSAKLATTSTGIDVTGTVTADGVITDPTNGVKINTSAVVEASWTHNASLGTSTLNVGRDATWGGELIIQTDTKNRANFASNGDISFYEDTGTTPKLFWDASAESLGIGTSSPLGQLHINTESAEATKVYVDGEANQQKSIEIRHYDTSEGSGAGRNLFYLKTPASGRLDIGNFTDGSAETQLMTFLESGNVGIGTSSPTTRLDVRGGVNSAHATFTGQASRGLVISTANTLSNDDAVVYNAQTASSGKHIFQTGATERMRIDSSGNVGIGTTSPSAKVDLVGGDITGGLKISADKTTSAFFAFGADANETRITSTSYGGYKPLTVHTGGSERMRILSDGAAAFGCTTSRPAEFTHPDGFAIRYDVRGQFQNTVTNAACGIINRDGTDGDLLSFRKDGTTVGSIGTLVSSLTIGSGDTGLILQPAYDRILPFNVSTNAGRDNAIDLGASGSRFKDLYLSGTASATSVTSAQHLTAGSAYSLLFGDGGERISGNNSSSLLNFFTGATERMRIDSSGNLLVGKSTTDFGTVGIRLEGPNGKIEATRSNNVVMDLNRINGNGDILVFSANTSPVGSIGTSATANFHITSKQTGHGGIEFGTANIMPMLDGVLNDNATDLGNASYRWDDIYATNGTIQTSDRNEKQDIAELSEAEQRVAVACKGLLRKFRWKDSVAEKGDEARIHFGIIAQDLQAAFAAEGLDAGDYAMFISTTWTDEETNEEKTRMGVRYSELLAFIIAAL